MVNPFSKLNEMEEEAIRENQESSKSGPDKYVSRAGAYLGEKASKAGTKLFEGGKKFSGFAGERIVKLGSGLKERYDKKYSPEFSNYRVQEYSRKTRELNARSNYLRAENRARSLMNSRSEARPLPLQKSAPRNDVLDVLFGNGPRTGSGSFKKAKGRPYNILTGNGRGLL